MIIIKGIPMPPSVNQLYANAKKGRRRSKEYQAYYDHLIRWVALNSSQVWPAQDSIKKLLANSQFLHVNRTFWHPASEILTKDSKPKRNDTSNRLKALDDALAEMLCIDDCHFWSGGFYKVPYSTAPSGQLLTSWVDVEIRSIEL